MHRYLCGFLLSWSVRSLHAIRVDPSISDLDQAELDTDLDNETEKLGKPVLFRTLSGRVEQMINHSEPQNRSQTVAKELVKTRGLTFVGLAQVGINAFSHGRRISRLNNSTVWLLLFGGSGSVLLVVAILSFLLCGSPASNDCDQTGDSADSRKQEVQECVASSSVDDQTEGRIDDNFQAFPEEEQTCGSEIEGNSQLRGEWLSQYLQIQKALNLPRPRAASSLQAQDSLDSAEEPETAKKKYKRLVAHVVSQVSTREYSLHPSMASNVSSVPRMAEAEKEEN